jgi:transcriptional regulator with XRE-family HTH domain
MHYETTHDPFEGLGTALRWLRDRRGLTQAQAAEKAGISKAALSRYEHGRTLPTLETLGRLLRALGCDLFELQRALTTVQGWDRIHPRASAAREDEVRRAASEVANLLSGKGLDREE